MRRGDDGKRRQFAFVDATANDLSSTENRWRRNHPCGENTVWVHCIRSGGSAKSPTYLSALSGMRRQNVFSFRVLISEELLNLLSIVLSGGYAVLSMLAHATSISLPTLVKTGVPDPRVATKICLDFQRLDVAEIQSPRLVFSSFSPLTVAEIPHSAHREFGRIASFMVGDQTEESW